MGFGLGGDVEETEKSTVTKLQSVCLSKMIAVLNLYTVWDRRSGRGMGRPNRKLFGVTRVFDGRFDRLTS